MKHLLKLALAFTFAFSSIAQAQETMWLGEFRLDGKATAVILHDRSLANTEASVIDIPEKGANGIPLKQISATPTRMRFAMQGGPDLYRFDGKRTRAGVLGTVSAGKKRGTFALVPAQPASMAEIRSIAGSYQIAPGHIIDIGPMDEFAGQLVFIDHKTLREGPLYRLTDGSYVTGPTLGIPYPFAMRATIVRDKGGAVTGMRWHDGQRTQAASKIAPHRTEDVAVVNGAVTLKGTLSVPATPGPHPAIVFAHGSGDSTRNVGMWNVYFARLGFAVLSLDKRGAGQSTGNWHTASMEDIAGDWLAGVAMLRQRPDIDPRRIGVHGSSQGGWTAPLMATRSDDIAFVIVRAGSAVSVIDTMVYEVGWSVREAGFAEADAREAEQAARAMFTLAGADWPAFEAAASRYKDKRWAQHAWPIHMSKDGWGRGWSVRNASFDPASTLARLKVPVLWFLGAEDHNVPSSLSAERLKAAQRASGNGDFTVVMLPEAGHGFTRTTTGNNSEFARQTHMAPGYWDTMEAWFRQRGYLGADSGGKAR